MLSLDTRPQTRALLNRRPLRPLPLLAMLCLTALTLAATPARAGYYAASFSGGTYDDGSGDSQPDIDDGQGDYYTPNYAYGGSPVSSVQGTFTVTCTWVPDDPNNPQSDPPPQDVVLDETGVAYYESNDATLDGGTCSDGLGDPAVPGVNGLAYATSGSPRLDNDHYSVHAGGASFSYQRTATVSSGGDSYGYMIYSVSVDPVTIDPVGATSDGSDGWDILVGQKCSPALIGVSGSCAISNYSWTVTGTTMQSWTANATQATEADGPGPLDISDPIWFWNDPQTTTEKITGTATVTPPAGQGAAFTVTASQMVGVYLPVWNAKGIGGQMLVDQMEPNESGTGYWLHAAPDPSNPTEKGGMTWYAYVSPPQAPVQFDAGNLYLVQLITPGDGYIDMSNQEWVDGAEGQLGLDTSWPYGWVEYEDSIRTAQPDYQTNDNPGIGLTRLMAIYGFVSESFQDYIMYQPPDSPAYVPLGKFTWNTNGAAIIPGTNNWADFTNPAGPITPSGSFVSFTTTHTYPVWTQNSGNGIGFVRVQ